MHDRMVDLQRYTATSGERDFVERIKAPIFLVAVSAIYIYNVSPIPIKKRKSTAVS